MTPPINRIDLERVLLALPPETQDPHPHLANLTAVELLKRRVWISAQLKSLEQERKAIDLEIEETYSIAELKFGIAITGGWIMKSNTRTSWEYAPEVIEEIKASIICYNYSTELHRESIQFLKPPTTALRQQLPSSFLINPLLKPWRIYQDQLIQGISRPGNRATQPLPTALGTPLLGTCITGRLGGVGRCRRCKQ